MNEKNEVFKKLLPIKDVYNLYTRLSDTLITRIDIQNLNHDCVAVNNTINMLCEIEVIQFDNDNKIYLRNTDGVLDFKLFTDVLYTRLKSTYKDAFSFTSYANIKYDEAEAKLYIKRNSVNLNLSGLLMLLDSMGKIKIKQNDIFIIDKNLLYLNKDNLSLSVRQRTLEDLKKQLALNEIYGEEAELEALEYEKFVLTNDGINNVPERISEYHVDAGYDIVSYMCINSNIPDKFIEVKSCANDNWMFFISVNELEVAKNKQNNYFLYLFNRETKMFRIIQNPYNTLVESDQDELWAIEPQVYQIKSLEKFI